MNDRARASKFLEAADALSVSCDQLEELGLLVCVLLTSLCAAQAYRCAGNALAAAGAVEEATHAFAGASVHYTRAGYDKNAETMRDRALGGQPGTMSITLNGRQMDAELPVLPKGKVRKVR